MIPSIDTIESERVDDIPLLIAAIKELGIDEIFNGIVPQHGNWTGLSAGTIIAVWLAYVLSTGDHRKSHLQAWVAARRYTLQQALGVRTLHELDFTDDRLAILLSKLSADAVWQQAEQALNRRAIRVYALEPRTVRVDTTTASSYGTVSEDGLLQFGYSKDHRPDLGQVKIASATLDPLGMPLVSLTVPGAQADDGLYLPLIEAARHSVASHDALLYVGDSKMGALATRAAIAAHGDHYLMPLPKTATRQAQLADYLAQFEARPADQQQLERLYASADSESPQLIAQGFSITQTRSAPHPAPEVQWVERRLIVRSEGYAQRQAERLAQQLEQAEAALQQLTQRRQGYRYPTSHAELEQRVQQVLARYNCAAYLQVEIKAHTQSTMIRKYKDRPARTQLHTTFELMLKRRTAALEQARRLLGWRIYVTNAPEQHLPLRQAVEVYRDAYLHEYGYSRLKGKPLSLTPMYLQKEQQIVGLTRLLALALRLLSVIEFVVRRQLAHADCALSGLYAGNKSRATRRPRTETLLAAFRGITLTVIQVGQERWRHLPPLSATQQRILELLSFSPTIYSDLASNSS